MAATTATTPASAQDVAAHIPRNLVLGTAIVFAIAVGICLLAGLTPFDAAAVAALPSLVAGPFIGGLITMISYHHAAPADA